MRKKTALRKLYEQCLDVRVPWHTFRKRVKLGWRKEEALTIPANGKQHISDLVDQDDLPVSMRTIYRRMKDKTKYKHDATRLRHAVKDAPYKDRRHLSQ